MRSHDKKLLIIAHPDDEIIFFAQILLPNPQDFHIVLVTDGNGDGQGIKRLEDFKKVMQAIKVSSFESWSFPDVFDQKISQIQFNEKLRETCHVIGAPSHVYTHGPLGEYGHPHHIQVCELVHRFSWESEVKIYHPDELGLIPQESIIMDELSWELAVAIMTNEYASEYVRFFNLLPIKRARAYIQDQGFVLNVIEYSREESQKESQEELSSNRLGPYRPYSEILKLMASKVSRPF